jgi:hypothetical protein
MLIKARAPARYDKGGIQGLSGYPLAMSIRVSETGEPGPGGLKIRRQAAREKKGSA